MKPSQTSSKRTSNIAKIPRNQSLSKQSKTPTQNTIPRSASKQIEENRIPIDCITKENYDIIDSKFNITDIPKLEVKYVLKCVGGIYKNRFLYITTHKEGEIIGSGDAKQHGLTLQVQGAGLANKHVKLKFNGFKKFYVKDYGSQSGTWMTIPKEGAQIKHGDVYILGQIQIRFELGHPVNQIQELCHLYNCNYLSDTLIYNKIVDMASLYEAQYEKFKGYPFDSKTLSVLNSLCQQSKQWFNLDKEYRIVHMFYQDEEIVGLSQQVGWKPKKVYSKMEDALTGDFLYEAAVGDDKNKIQCSYQGEIVRGRLIPREKVFAKILPDKNYPLQLHDQIKIGGLSFELMRFNVGVGEDIGLREDMEDCYIFEEDVGGSEWKLISLFAVVDGYGGVQCVNYIKKKLLQKIREWTPLLDEAGDLNTMLKVLMNKTFFEIDYQFYKAHQDIALTCGATIVVLLIIDSKAYSFNLGDSKGYIYRGDKLYQLAIDHIPSRGDEKIRIEQAGGMVQYNRLMGKCTLSRAMGQFEYKDLEDYERGMKGKLKSYLSCLPEINCFDLKPEQDEFILLTTDGIIEGLGIQAVCSYILERAGKLESQQNPNKIVSSLMENSKMMSPTCDNMAVILVFLKKGRIGSKLSF